MLRRSIAGLLFLGFMVQPLLADDKPVKQMDKASGKSTAPGVDSEKKLVEFLSGAKLIGKFTIDGKKTPPKTEAYTISKCEKLPKPDMYRLTARIKYGDIDQEVPLEIKILWAGRTPVMTLDNFWIPGMGTFGARVLFHGDRYTGTWQHDEVGGHMFGKVEVAKKKE